MFRRLPHFGGYSLRKHIETEFPQWRPEYEKSVEVYARVTLSGEFLRWAMSSGIGFRKP